jgi:hypothetical protein
MRCLVLLILVACLAATGLRAEVPPLLEEAFRKFTENVERWAYTETIVRTDMRGNPEGETVVRFDPSKPYAEQIQPLKIEGRTPTPAEAERFRKRRERRQQREESQTLGRLILPDQVTLLFENAETVTYEIGLRRTGNRRLPPDKFQVLVRLNKVRREFENITVRVREPFRVALVASVKSGRATLDFTSVSPEHPAPLGSIKAEGMGSMLLVRLTGNYELRRTDLRRVKPYSDNFTTSVGDLRVLDF